jgi:lactoylglutathione lyase
MTSQDSPEPAEGFVLTHFAVVSDQDRSRQWYERVLGAQTVRLRDPVVMKVANGWIILNVGGGLTEDKPDVVLSPPSDPTHTSAFLNIRVADIERAYRDWTAAGAEFLTEPKNLGTEIRCYMRDPDGHLIEVGQAVGGG